MGKTTDLILGDVEMLENSRAFDSDTEKSREILFLNHIMKEEGVI